MHSYTDFMNTITKIILVFSLLVCSNIVNAQKQPKKRFTSDLRFGFNLADMDVTPLVDGIAGNDKNDTKLGVHIGMNVNYKIIGNFQIQSGFFVSKKGLKQHIITVIEEDPGGASTIKNEQWTNITGNYIQVPLNVGYELYFAKKWAFNINGGLYLAYGYKGKKTERSRTISQIGDEPAAIEEYPESERETFYQIDGWKRFDYGLNGSVGVIYDIYTLNFNYEHGLNNVSNSFTKNMKHRNFTVSLGFRF